VKESLIKDKSRIKLIGDLDGGIRNAHFHIDDGIALINQAKMEEMLGRIGKEL